MAGFVTVGICLQKSHRDGSTFWLPAVGVFQMSLTVPKKQNRPPHPKNPGANRGNIP